MSAAMAVLSVAAALAFHQAVFAQTSVTGGLSFTSLPYVNPTKITDNSAVIYWITSQEASTVVYFGKTPQLELGSRRDIDLMTGDSVSVLVHNFFLSGLDADTTYYYKAQSSDGATTITADPGQFHTLKPTVTVPLCAESDWSCGQWGTCSMDGVQSRTCIKAATSNCAGGVAHAASETQKCTYVPPTPACAESDWSCGQWGTCSADGTQIRTCAKTATANCVGGVSHESSEKQNCTYVAPLCAESDWSCGQWGACTEEGNQVRTCSKKSAANCAGGVAHAASETQKCSYVPPLCAEKDWSCGQWGACTEESNQTRTCSKKATATADCAGGVTHSAEETQKCAYVAPPVNEPVQPEAINEPAAPPSVVCGDGKCDASESHESCSQDCPLPTGVPVDVNEPPTVNEPINQPTGGKEPSDGTGLAQTIQDLLGAQTGSLGSIGHDLNEPTNPSFSMPSGGGGQDPNQPDLPAGEPLCLENGISAARCAMWLEAKFADKTCLDAGKMTKESCEVYLTEKNGGVFPGCEGKTAEECQKVKNLTTLGYLPSDTRDKLDQVIDGAIQEDVVVSVVGITAVSPEGAKLASWWKSQTATDDETSSVVTVQDSDHDGLPDDVERRLGTDPNKADTNGDGINDGDSLRQGLNPLGGGKAEIHLGPVDQAIVNGRALGQPLGNATTDDSFHIGADLTNGSPNGGDPNAPPFTAPSGVTLSGTCVPNSVCLIYIYSYIPMVMTVATDANGNFNVDLGKSVVDGEHTVYVAMADENGRVTAKSDPISLFVRAARAATKDEFLQPDISTPKTPSYLNDFLLAAFGVVAFGVLAVYLLIIRRKTTGLPPKAGV